MSTTKREEFWKNEIDAPFTKQTYTLNPGPGQYDHDKKKNDMRSKILMEEAVHIPFNSSNERECNKKIKNIIPGPGSYIDINNPQNSAIGKSLLKFREDRSFAESQGVKLGAFGSN